jgi:hypothetical protein
MLRELLTEHRDFGTLLGGGSGPGGPPGGALGAYVPDPEERKRLFEAVAYECQVRRGGGGRSKVTRHADMMAGSSMLII